MLYITWTRQFTRWSGHICRSVVCSLIFPSGSVFFHSSIVLNISLFCGHKYVSSAIKSTKTLKEYLFGMNMFYIKTHLKVYKRQLYNTLPILFSYQFKKHQLTMINTSVQFILKIYKWLPTSYKCLKRCSSNLLTAEKHSWQSSHWHLFVPSMWHTIWALSSP